MEEERKKQTKIADKERLKKESEEHHRKMRANTVSLKPVISTTKKTDL